VIAQIVRQISRAIGAYFSDLLLWLSLASLVEIAAVAGAGLLCILTAGFFFEGMKKSPVIMTLGGLVALTGTFLMFREVGGLLPWPARAPVVAPVVRPIPGPPAPSPPSKSRPSTPPSALPKFGFPPSTVQPGSVAGMPTHCALASRQLCEASLVCYWSKIIDRCQPLLFGTGPSLLGAGSSGSPGLTKSAASCFLLTEEQCRSKPGCRLSGSICMPDAGPMPKK